jgi:hypothetical protein
MSWVSRRRRCRSWAPELEDKFGSAAAAIMLKHSLDPEVTESTMQFDTVRKMKSAFVNITSVENESTATIGGKEGKNQFVLGAPVHHGWYDRAQVEMHHRMVDKVVQDYGLFREAALALQNLLEREWELAATDQEKRMEVPQLPCFVFLGYGQAFRGEEISKIELTVILKNFEEGGTAQQKHVTLSLVGIFKQVEGKQQHFLPAAAVTGFARRITSWSRRLTSKSQSLQG